jgi:hypothetical protein
MIRQEIIKATVVILATFSFATASADDYDSDQSDLELSMRTNVLVGDAAPANNIMGIGVIGRYYLDDGWFTGATLDSYEYDYEHSIELIDLVQYPAETDVETAASNTVLSGFFGRVYGVTDKGFDWFWSAGVGLGFREIGDLSDTEGGESLAISYNTGTEYLLTGALGTSYHFTPTWSATFAARLEHHFIDVTATDTVSGASTTIGSQSPYGAYFSIDFRF